MAKKGDLKGVLLWGGIVFSIIAWIAIMYTSTNTLTLNSRAAVRNCTYTSPELNLSEFNLMLPAGPENNPTEIFQPQLRSYQDAYFFPSSDCKTIYFQAPTNGSTSSGSDYPRSELRETINNGQTRYTWKNTVGTHIMEYTAAITRVPNGKKEVVVGQVHNTKYDAVVVRLNDKRLFINTEGGGTYDLTTNYVLGTPFTIKFEAKDGKVFVYYNNSPAPVFTYTRSLSTAFFKLGVYVQSNCATESKYGAECGTENIGQAAISAVKITHTSNSNPTPTKTPTPPKATKTPTRTPTPPRSATSTPAPTSAFHGECRNKACYVINTPGVNQCTKDADCL